MVFSKSLTGTEIKKRLSIPSNILPSLPSFNRSHAVRIKLMYGTEIWPIICTIRKKGYKKPFFSGPLWRNFVISKKLRIGDRIRMYKVHDGCSDCRLEVEKPTATSNMELAMGASANESLVEHHQHEVMNRGNGGGASFTKNSSGDENNLELFFVEMRRIARRGEKIRRENKGRRQSRGNSGGDVYCNGK
ncbi:hypothetical protein Godav_003184, partial [Gossypium davidsonii]|nr:hypothetical protein [Gossypium davidsonii]